MGMHVTCDANVERMYDVTALECGLFSVLCELSYRQKNIQYNMDQYIILKQRAGKIGKYITQGEAMYKNW